MKAVMIALVLALLVFTSACASEVSKTTDVSDNAQAELQSDTVDSQIGTFDELPVDESIPE